MPAPQQSKYWVPILGHAFRVLEILCDTDSELSLQEVCVRSGVTKSSAFRILFTLENLGYVTKNPKNRTYRVGLKILEAARKVRASRSAIQVIRPYMKELFDHFGETVNLAEYRSGDIYFVDIVESSHPFRMTAQVGWRSDFHASSLGKAIAAFLPEDALKALLDRGRLPRLTRNTITNRADFLKAMAKVRRQGYSEDNEEVEEGASCLGVPILADGQHATHALSVSAPTPRLTAKRNTIIKELKRAAAQIAQELAL